MGEVIELLPDLEGDLDIAWRLAYVMLADEAAAADVARQAFAHTVGAESTEEADRVHLLAMTLQLTADRVVEGPEVDRPLISAFWRLPADQRAALWLSAVERLGNAELGEVLGVPAATAKEAVSDAKNWLEVVMERTSGPLCREEPNLAEYLRGELPAQRAAELKKHIRTCPTCRTRVETFEEFADLRHVLRNALPDSPDTLTTGALEVLPPEAGGPIIDLDDRESFTLPSPVRWLALSCAGLLVLGLIGLGIIHRASGTSGKAPSVPPSVSTTVPASATSPTVPAATDTASTPAPPVTFPSAPPP